MESKRAFILTAILIFASFIIAGIVSVQSMRNVIQNSQRELTLSLASQIHDEITIELTRPLMASLTMSNDFFLKQLLRDPNFPNGKQAESDVINYLKNICEGFNYNTAFVVSHMNGNYYTQDGYNKTVDPANDAHDIWYSTFVGNNVKYFLNVDTDEAHRNVWTVFSDVRVEDDDGTLLGVCGVGVDMTYLQDIIKKYEELYNIKVDMVNEDGLVQVDSNTENIEILILQQAVENFDKDLEYTYSMTPSGGCIVTKFIDSFRWYLVVEKDAEDISIYLNVIRRLSIWFVVVMTVLLTFVFFIQKRDRQRLEEEASTDALTGLLNRKIFISDAKKIFYSEKETPAAFLFIDLDHLKDVNDKLGHAAGDKAIVAAADTISEIFRQMDTVGRFGGDEFVVFLKNIPESILNEKIETLLEKMKCSYGEGEKAVHVTTSIGAVFYEKHPDIKFRELMEMADVELYKAKEGGRNQASLKKLDA